MESLWSSVLLSSSFDVFKLKLSFRYSNHIGALPVNATGKKIEATIKTQIIPFQGTGFSANSIKNKVGIDRQPTIPAIILKGRLTVCSTLFIFIKDISNIIAALTCTVTGASWLAHGAVTGPVPCSGARSAAEQGTGRSQRRDSRRRSRRERAAQGWRAVYAPSTEAALLNVTSQICLLNSQ